jgi:hypothetical protein
MAIQTYRENIYLVASVLNDNSGVAKADSCQDVSKSIGLRSGAGRFLYLALLSAGDFLYYRNSLSFAFSE